jgi:cysteine synthase
MLYAIGNTPMVRLQKITTGTSAEILIKLEYYNPTGSLQGGWLYLYEEAEARGELRPGMRLGDTREHGLSLAFVCG